MSAWDWPGTERLNELTSRLARLMAITERGASPWDLRAVLVDEDGEDLAEMVAVMVPMLVRAHKETSDVGTGGYSPLVLKDAGDMLARMEGHEFPLASDPHEVELPRALRDEVVALWLSVQCQMGEGH